MLMVSALLFRPQFKLRSSCTSSKYSSTPMQPNKLHTSHAFSIFLYCNCREMSAMNRDYYSPPGTQWQYEHKYAFQKSVHPNSGDTTLITILPQQGCLLPNKMFLALGCLAIIHVYFVFCNNPYHRNCQRVLSSRQQQSGYTIVCMQDGRNVSDSQVVVLRNLALQQYEYCTRAFFWRRHMWIFVCRSSKGINIIGAILPTNFLLAMRADDEDA